MYFGAVLTAWYFLFFILFMGSLATQNNILADTFIQDCCTCIVNRITLYICCFTKQKYRSFEILPNLNALIKDKTLK